MIGGAAVTWRSQRQITIARSTVEAEYLGLGEAIKEVLWIPQHMLYLNSEKVVMPVPVYEDNVGCIKLTNNPVFHHRTKHIEVRHHFLREHTKPERVDVVHVDTDMIANVFTKPPAKVKLQKFRDLLGMTPVVN
jgi:hypothetical protein